MKWTTPADLRNQVLRFWERGIVLQSVLSDQPVFPRRLVLKAPSSQDLAHSFAETRSWCETLSKMANVRFGFREVRHRVSGTNTYPNEAWIESAEDAVKLLAKTREWRQFNWIIETTRQRCPELIPWIAKRPLTALDAAEEWERFLDLVEWLLANPRPGCYPRQVDLSGIDTKFIEGHRGLLSELFDFAMPADAIDTAHTGVGGFSRRYGFRDKPGRIRFRVLDSKCDPLGMDRNADITLDIDTFSNLKCTPKNLYITENETNFLAFPEITESWILFGAGYGFAPLRQAQWMTRCRIIYWGDIDTHGFAVLNELRSVFPSAESILMDRITLLSHRHSWGVEPNPCTRRLSRLTEDEAALYADLQANRLADNLRLEQERVSFSHLLEALSANETRNVSRHSRLKAVFSARGPNL